MKINKLSILIIPITFCIIHSSCALWNFSKLSAQFHPLLHPNFHYSRPSGSNALESVLGSSLVTMPPQGGKYLYGSHCRTQFEFHAFLPPSRKCCPAFGSSPVVILPLIDLAPHRVRLA